MFVEGISERSCYLADVCTCSFLFAFCWFWSVGLPPWGSPGPPSYSVSQDLGTCWQFYLQSPTLPLLRSSSFTLKTAPRVELLPVPAGLLEPAPSSNLTGTSMWQFCQKDHELREGWWCAFSSLWQLLTHFPLVMIKWLHNEFTFLSCWMVLTLETF